MFLSYNLILKDIYKKYYSTFFEINKLDIIFSKFSKFVHYKFVMDCILCMRNVV